MTKKKIRLRARKSEYLLDTGIIRSLTPHNVEELIKRKPIATFKVSYLVPIEILSGTLPKDNPKSDNENRWRKAGLNKYYRLIGLNGTEWEDENVIIAKAFGVQGQGSNKLNVSDLIQKCVHSKTFNDVETQSIRDKALLKQIRERDPQMVDWFRNGLETTKEAFQKYPTYNDARIARAAIFVLFSELASAFAALQTPRVYMTDEQFGAFVQERLLSYNEMTSEQFEAIIQTRRLSYNGSLDFVMDISTTYWEELRTNQRPIGKKIYNDVFDLRHLLYFRKDNTNEFFVTGDSNLHRLVQKVVPGRVLNKAAFLKRVLAY